MQENATPAKYQSMGNGFETVPRSCFMGQKKGCCVLLQSNCTAAFLRLYLRRRGGRRGDGMGAEVIDPDGVAFGLDVVAVLLGVLSFQVAVFVGEDFPQIEEGAVLFQRDGGQLVC